MLTGDTSGGPTAGEAPLTAGDDSFAAVSSLVVDAMAGVAAEDAGVAADTDPLLDSEEGVDGATAALDCRGGGEDPTAAQNNHIQLTHPWPPPPTEAFPIFLRADSVEFPFVRTF